jgi:hypothetical protein
MAPVAVAIGDFDNDGRPDLVTANTNTNAVNLLLDDGQGGFKPPAPLVVGTGPSSIPSSVAVIDLTGNGKKSIVAATSDGMVSVLLGNGNGTFQPPVNYTVGSSPSFLTAADLGSGKLDLAVANAGSNNVSILLGNGNGTFQPSAVNVAVGAKPSAVAVGDLRGKGKKDLVVTNADDNNVSVLLGIDETTYEHPVNYSLGSGNAKPSAVVVGDFNRDGKADVVVANRGFNNLSLLLGLGDGTLQQPAVSIAAGMAPSALVAADFNGDGKLGLAVANSGSNTVRVLLGNGNGTFQALPDIMVGANPVALAVGDLNNDGAPDLVTANQTGNNVSVILNQPEAARFTVAAASTMTTAGNDLDITVTAKDNFNNIVTGYRGTVRLTSSDNQADGLVTYTFTSADSGTHAFKVKLKTAGSQSVTATDTTTMAITGTQTGITVTAAAVIGLAMPDFPSSTRAGELHDIVVTAKDAFGNTVSSYTGTARLTSSDSQFTPVEAAFADGKHTFSVALKTAGSQSLTATDKATSSITGMLGNITVTPDVAATLLVAGYPTPAVAGEPHSITVTAKDAFGNTATGYTGTVQFTSSDGQAVLPGNYAFVPGDAGTHTFSVTLKTTGAQSLTAADTAAAVTGGQSGITVNPAPFSAFGVSGFPAETTAGEAHSFTVAAHDAFGNTVPGYTGTVRFSSSDNQAVLPGNYAFVPGDMGAHTFSATFKTAGSRSLTTTDTVTNASGTQSGITVDAAGAATLLLTDFPTATTAGVAHNFTVTLKDAFGNNAAGYAGTVHFSSSDDQATLPDNYTFVSTDAGTHTFSVTLKTAGNRSITVSDATTSSLTATQTGIAVTPAAVSMLGVSGFPSPTTAGMARNFTVTAQDAFGNTVLSYTGTVRFTSSDNQAVLPGNYTFVAGDMGAHTFTATLKTAGSESITATDAAATTVSGAQTGILINSEAAVALVLAGFPSPATAGVLQNFTLTAKDVFGNNAAGYTGTVHFTSSDSQAVLPDNYTFVAGDAGIHTFSATFKTAGAQSLTATDTSARALTSTQAGIAVIPDVVATLAVTGFPSPTTAGTAHNFTVTAQDAFGNAVTGYAGTVTFSSTDGQAGLPSRYTFTGGDRGRHTFSATLKTAGARALMVDDAAEALTGSQAGITVQPAAAARYLLSAPDSASAGSPLSVSVTVVDAFNNTVTGYGGAVRFSSSDPAAVLPANYTFALTDSGTHTFTVSLYTAGSKTIAATDTANGSVAASATVVVSPSATVTEIDSSANPADLDQAVTFTATVAVVSPGTGTPTGTMTFLDGDVILRTVPLSGGKSTFTTSSLSAGDHEITARYDGQGNVGPSTSPPLTQAVGTVSQRFVAQVYRDLLHRPVDPTGLGAFTNALSEGATDSQVVLVIEGSEEYRAVVVRDMYKTLLHRDADAGGLNSFVAFLGSGGTVEQVQAIIAGSAEYLQQRGGGGNDGFLSALYQDALKRGIDDSGRTAFVKALAAGATREQVARAIFSSTEYRQNLVQGYYKQFLRRDAEQSGRDAFGGLLQAGARDQEVISDIAGSDEYRSRL